MNNHIALLLSSTRNRLLNLEITIDFATLGLSLAGVIGAIFGMNLTSGLEDMPYMFASMTVLALALALIVTRVGRVALLRARSIKGQHHGLLHQPTRMVK